MNVQASPGRPLSSTAKGWILVALSAIFFFVPILVNRYGTSWLLAHGNTSPPILSQAPEIATPSQLAYVRVHLDQAIEILGRLIGTTNSITGSLGRDTASASATGEQFGVLNERIKRQQEEIQILLSQLEETRRSMTVLGSANQQTVDAQKSEVKVLEDQLKALQQEKERKEKEESLKTHIHLIMMVILTLAAAIALYCYKTTVTLKQLPEWSREIFKGAIIAVMAGWLG